MLLLAGIGFAVARAGLAAQVAGLRLGNRWAMADFYSGLYYPVRAFLAGANPHNREWFLATYPVRDGYPPYLPLNLLLHLPFGALPPGSAAIAFLILNVALTIALAFLSLRLAGVVASPRAVILLAGAILLTRPGHWNLIQGQRAAELAVMSYGAVYLADRSPRFGALALAASLIKPTYGLPLALLMFARGYRRVVVLGLAIGAAVNLPLVMLLASWEGGTRPFLTSLITGYQAWQNVGEVGPASSPHRVDAVSTISRFLGAPLTDWAQIAVPLLILVVAALVLRRRDSRGSSPLSSVDLGIMFLAVLLSSHHVGYDLLLLTSPFVALLVRPEPPMARWAPARWLLVGLFAVPALNWASTHAVLAAWQPSRTAWLIVTSANGLCLALLFVAYLRYGLRVGPITADSRPARRVAGGAEPLPST